MEIEDKREVEASRDEVIERMQEPAALERAIPNCQQVTQVGERQYEARIHESISMVSMDLDVEMEITEFDPPDYFCVELKGSDAESRSDFTADLEFYVDDPIQGRTSISYRITVNVTGKLASIGFRVLRRTAETRIDQMSDSIEQLFDGPQSKPSR